MTGDNNSDNLVCVYPNHHVMFDKGAFSILDNLKVIGANPIHSIEDKSSLKNLIIRFELSVKSLNLARCP